MHLSARSLLGESLGDLRRAWPQLVVTDLMAKILAVVIITPAIGLLVKLFLWRTATGVLTDEAIASFVLHPFGLAALVVVAAVSLGILFAETGQLMVIGFGAVEDRRVTWLDALVYTFRRVAALVSLAASAVVRLLLIAAPFLAATGILYWLLGRTHDINYYLAQKPPEFMAALLGAGILVAALALIVVWKIAGWLISLPLVLFEGISGTESLPASVSVTRSMRWKIVAWLVGWLAATGVVSAVMTRVIGFVGRVTVSSLEGDINWLLICLSAIIIVGGLANLALSIVTTVLFPLLVVRFYRAVAGPGELRPEMAPAGSLGPRPSFRVRGIFVLGAGVVAALAIVVGVSLAVDDPGWEDPTQIIAHRGGAWVAPENTLAAFERGIADGADWIELDVQENADGTVVVEHDRDFMRVAGTPLDVWKATDADLADLDIGTSFAPEYADQRVPTLREVLELAKGKAGVFVELKYYGHDVNLEQKVVDLIEETGMADQIVVMSLKYDGVRKVAGLRPDWIIGLLNAVAVGDLTRLEVDFLALTADTTSRTMIRRTHKRGMKIYPWTIDDPVQMWMMMSRGVDGIITNRVVLANRIKELRADLTPTGRFIIWMAAETGLLRGVGEASSEEDA